MRTRRLEREKQRGGGQKAPARGAARRCSEPRSPTTTLRPPTSSALSTAHGRVNQIRRNQQS